MNRLKSLGNIVAQAVPILGAYSPYPVQTYYISRLICTVVTSTTGPVIETATPALKALSSDEASRLQRGRILLRLVPRRMCDEETDR